MCAPDPFAQAWPTILNGIQNLTHNCREHAGRHPEVQTGVNRVRNCIIDHGVRGVTVRSARSHNVDFVNHEDFAEVWGILVNSPGLEIPDLDPQAMGVGMIRTRVIGALLEATLPCIQWINGGAGIGHVQTRHS